MGKVLLKKVCLVVSVLLGLGSNVQAQKTSVTFNVSDGGKTLTISGQGDLTTYQAVSDELKFTPDAYTKVDCSNNQKVSATTVYDVNDTYKADYPQKITSLYPDYVSADVAYSWNEDKITAGLYHYGLKSGSTWEYEWTKVESTDNVDTDISWPNGIKSSNYATSADGTGRILYDDFLNGNYYTTSLTNVTFKSDKIDNLYVVSDNKYVKLAADAIYKATESYYYFLGDWSQYREINEADLIRMGYLEHPTEGVAQMLNYMLTKSNTYEKIQFANVGTGAMTINKDIVKAILYPSATANSVLTTLDLGAATCKDFSKETFAADGANGTLALTNLTLPLTNKTSVLSESTGTNEDKMVVPTQVLSRLNSVPTTVTIPEGYDRVGDEAFANSLITNINFPNTLTLIGERAFENCKNIASITLNEGLENIGESAFSGTTLETVKFPSSLKIINDCAFANCHIYNLKFNAGLKYIGNSAFALSNKHTEKVLEIPASVIYIGPYAFNFRQYQDVYFYGEKAPLMPLGSYKLDISTKDLGTAFPQQTLNGNNGFDPLPKEGEEITGDDTSSGYANRENYKNQGVYLCMLHYPKELSDENRDTYTDITRVYKTYRTADGKFIATDTGTDEATDKVGKEEKDEILNAGLCHSFKKVTWGYADTYLGEQYIWPSHSQFNRAYCTASHSVKWDGVTPVTCDLSAEEIAALKYAGYDTSEQNLDELKKIAHMGTRQFVLANADAFVDDKPEEEPTYPINIKVGQWWTICVPFDMTKAQVDKVFGPGTHVCRFNKVERVVNSEEKVKSIKLFFTNDVYVHKSTKDESGKYTTSTGTPVADDDIVIYAHESYMIYPTNNDADANSMYNISDYTLVTGSPLPTLVKANELFTGGAQQSASGDADWNKEYRFVGNYQTTVAVAASEQGNSSEETVARDMKNVTVPQYSYIYAQKKGTSKAQFWFYTGKEMLWGANKCVVQATERDGGKSDFNTYFGGNGSARAKELSFFGTDDEVTGIENVEIIAGNENDTQIVYNLNGQVVNGNLNSLQKGIYIKNGKKFMVK